MSRRSPECHSWLEVNLGSVRHNVRAVKALLGPGRWLWAVVKANAYGHGAVPVAKAAAAAGADGLAVASLEEAAELRGAGIGAPILLLSPGDARMAGRAVRLGLTQTVCVEETIRALSGAAQQVDRQVGVHLKLDTGMGRLGVDPSEAVRFALVIAESPGVRLEGIFSHLATAEADDEAYARLQFVRYEAAVRGVREAGIEPGMRHIANSAATVRFPEMRLDGIRTGLLIYGIPPEAGGQGPLELQPALTWKTRVAFARTVPAGSSISYGRTYHTRQTAVIATLPIGYADGYPRRASNRGQVFLRGRRCPIVGTVCMDYMMIDTTPAGGVSLGDEVVLLGEQGSERITAHDLAVSAETCVHEVSTVIGRRVGRTYIDCDSP